MALEKNKRFSSACSVRSLQDFPGNKRLPYCNTQIQYQKNKQKLKILIVLGTKSIHT